MENSKIQWTDHTFNPHIGCTKVSTGCKYCYAKAQQDHRWHKAKWGPGGTRKRTSAAKWREPLKWNRQAAQEGRRYRVFCASLADVFELFPGLTAIRADLWQLIEATPNLDWQLLTKRPENIMGMVPMSWRKDWPAHVWIGTSIEDQATADERIGMLMYVPAAVRFVSAEPLLGPIRIDGYLSYRDFHGINWLIIGGESGPNARPMNLDWPRSLIAQCQTAGVAVFMKQLGTVAAKALACHHKKGGDLDEWPADLRIREFPRATLSAGERAAFEAAWPTMPELSDGKDLFAERHGPPTGIETG